MLFITGLLTLLAIAQAGGDHIKGGSAIQQKVAPEDIIPSPFNVKSAAAPFGTKVIQPEASGPVSKTARGSTLHHAVKTAAATASKTQMLPGLHHAASSSPVMQNQMSIEDPASGTVKSIKTVKTAASVRDPVARAVVRSTKTVQDPVAGTKQIKTIKMIDPVKPSFSEVDKQLRDPIARPITQTLKSAENPTLSSRRIKTLGAASTKTRFAQDPVAGPIIQTVKITEDPSASVVTKTVKTTVKTAESSNLRSTVKTSQPNADMLRIPQNPLSVVEAARRTTSSSANSALLSSQEGVLTSGIDERLIYNTLTDPQKQPESGLVNELGEMILDEETLLILQNAGGIINENGRIALNDEGIKILQNIRGGSLSTYSSRIAEAGLSNAERRAPASANPLVNTRSSSIRTSSAAAGSAILSPGNIEMSINAQNMNAPAMRSQVRTSQRSQTGSIRSRVTSGSVASSAGGFRSSPQFESNAGTGILSSNVLSSQGAGGAISGSSGLSGTALFNGKEISIDGLKEGQIFDENLRPISYDIGRIQSPGSEVLRVPPQSSPAAVLRTSSVSGVTRTRVGTSGSYGMSPVRMTPNVRSGSSGGSISNLQRTSQAAGIISTTGSLTSDTALFNGKEVTIDGLKKGQLFGENLRPLTPGAPMTSSGQTSGAPLRSAATKPSSRAPQRPQTPGLRSSAVTTASRGTISRSRTSSTLLTQSAPNVRVGPLSTLVSSSQGRTQSIGGIRSGGSLTSGTVLFNGKEISVDGLKEGQIFDENLRPITSGSPISGSGQISGAPLRSTAPKPIARTPQRSQSPVLRSPAVTSTSGGSVSRSRTTSTLLSQSTPNVRAGPLSTSVSPGQGRPQVIGGSRSGGSLTSGTVLFNGKEISIDGLKEGQMFDENLRPITSGAQISSSGQISGAPLRSTAPKPIARTQQRSQSPVLRSSAVTGTSRGSISRSRTTSTLVSQSRPNVRSGPLSTSVSPGQGQIQTIGSRPSGGSLTSGTVLFNGKEISIDGIKEGQMFDENLRPITSGAPFSSSGQISGAPLRSEAPKPSSRAPQTSQKPGLRSSAVTGTSRGSISRSRTSSTLLTQSTPNVRAGPLSTPVSSGQGQLQTIGSRTSGGSLTSGTVLFNGKEISIDGIKEGQMFDENLRPITTGTSVSSSGQISSVPSRSAASIPSARVPQRTSGLRSSSVTSTSRGTFTRSRTSNTLLSQPAPFTRTGPASTITTSGQIGSQTMRGINTGGTLTSGTALFNGKEISVDGLKEGPIFDENLQPILTGITGTTEERSAIMTRSEEISNIPFGNVAQIPETVRAQTGDLRSSVITSSLPSQPALRGGIETLSNTIPYEAGLSQTGVASRLGGSLTSGTALFNGQEIRIDGLKEGQMFDENLQPIMPGTTGVITEKASAVFSSGQVTGIPSRSIAPKPVSRSPQRLQTGTLRSSTITSSTGSSRSSTRAGTLITQTAPVLRAKSMSNTISTAAGRSQIASGVRSGGSLTSGKVLFNGKEISIDGLKEGQFFDENLRPITTGTSGSTSGASMNILGTTQTGGSPSRSIPKPRVRTSQTATGAGLRSSVTRGSSSGAFTSSRVSSSQSVTGTRTGSLMNTISSSAGGSQATVGARSQSSLTSGKVLFNGKEISIDGLKPGQMFDENLQPITTGTSGSTSGASMNILGTTQAGSSPSRSIPKPRVRTSQTATGAGLRSSVARSSSSGAFTSSRVSSSQSVTGTRTGSLMNTISSSAGGSQATVGARSQSSLTSGKVLFNGKEISIDGLKPGQMFDENLRPITTGTSGSTSGASMNILGTTQTGGSPSRSIPKPRVRTAQTATGAGLRSSVTRGSSSGAITSSRVSSSQSVTGTRTGSLMNTISSSAGGSQATVGARSQSSLTSGKVLFNGEEISIDGLKPGQIFDENLRPITTGTSGSTSGASMNVIGTTQTSGSPSSSIPKPRVRTSQTATGAALRSSVARGSSSGTFTSSRISGSQSVTGTRAGSVTNAISSSARSSQTAVGARSQSSLTSGKVLFNGKEISIDGLKPGQIFDENLRPITSDTSGTLPGRVSTTFQSSRQISGVTSVGAAPEPKLRSQVGVLRSVTTSSGRGSVGTSRSSGSALSQPVLSLRGESLGTRVNSGQGISATIGSGRSASGSVLFNGKEISIEDFKPGQLYDENLRPITSEVSGMVSEKYASLPGSTQRTNTPSQNVAPKPRMRAPQGSGVGGMRTSIVSSSSTGAVSGSRIAGGTSRGAANVRSGALPMRTSTVRSSQSVAGMRAGGSGTVLFNGKEISMDGIKEGQIFDENLRPIDPVSSYTAGITTTDDLSSIQRSSSRNLRTGASSSTSASRSQSSSSGGARAASGTLNYIDVTRTDDSSAPENILDSGRSAQRISTGGASAYASTYGSKVSQERITQELSQYGVDTPIQDSILNIPDDPFKKASSMKAPSISRQTQLKLEDVLEQSSLTKPDTLRSVQESLPFSIPVSSGKIAQISQKDTDIPVQQKLLEDYSGYLPKTSFLPPFNYALPQVSASKYISPMSQVQQKMEQVFTKI